MLQKLELYLIRIYYKLINFYIKQQEITKIEREKFYARRKKNFKRN